MIRRLVQVLLIALALEGGASLVTLWLVNHGWMAAIPRVNQEQIASYFDRRQPLLGWGPPQDPGGSIVSAQPRRDPGNPPDAPPCVSVYGESFTWGSGVGDEETYPHHLALILGCPAANYGVGGFGSDQAMMLARAQSRLDQAPIVILSHVSENILRNVNQYRTLLYPNQELAFKPRFDVEGDALRLIPLPVRQPADFDALRRDPGAVLSAEWFLSRPRRQFPYAISMLSWAVGDFHLRAALARVPRHEPFYHADHPARGLQVTTALLSTFARETRQRARRPLVVLIPVGRDFDWARRTGRWPDQPLADALLREHVPTVHAGPAMSARLKGEEPCHLFNGCSAHFNARGYRLLAEVVADVMAPTPAR